MRTKEKGQKPKGETIPEPQPPLLLPALLHSLGRELPDGSSCQEVHHRLVAFLRGKQLRNLHVAASARFPACQ